MGELIFVVKCLAVTAFLTFAMQLEMGGVRLERTFQSAIMNSPAVGWVQSAAAGGSLMIRQASRTVTTKFNELTSSDSNRSISSSAGR